MVDTRKPKYSSTIIKYATPSQAQEYFKIYRAGLMKVAEEAGAVVRIGRSVRIDIPKLDHYLEREHTV